jgi:hypothetical protein
LLRRDADAFVLSVDNEVEERQIVHAGFEQRLESARAPGTNHALAFAAEVGAVLQRASPTRR